MSQIERLITNYRKFVSLTWQQNLAGSQRVWFAVYSPSEERRLRARLKEFEVATGEARHKWQLLDVTAEPALWLGKHDYSSEYFQEPAALANIEQEFRSHMTSLLRDALSNPDVDPNTTVAVIGVGSVFGFTSVSSIVADIEGAIRGRLLIFFPGEYEKNLYRFMDARDGFNYMAVPITGGERLLI